MNWFYNLKIKFKFLLCFGILTVLINVCGYFAITGLKEMDTHSEESYNNMLMPVADLGKMATYFQNSRVDVRDMILYDDPSKVRQLYDQINDRNEKLGAIAESFHKTILNDEVRQEYNNFLETKRVYLEELNKIMDYALQGDKKAATDNLFGSAYKNARANEQASIEKLVSLITGYSKTVYESDQESNDKMVVFMTILINVCTVLAIIAWVFLGRGIAKPVLELEKAAGMVGEGKLDVTLSHKSKDEIGKLVNTFRKMLIKIKDEIALSESLKEGFQVPFMIADKETKITHYNKAAEKMFLHPASSVINAMNVKTLVGKDESTRNTLKGSPVFDIRYDTKDKDGNSIPVMVTTGMIRDGEGQINSAFILMNDLRKEQEKQNKFLAEQTKVLSEALENMSKGDLAFTVKMDEKSPLYALGQNLSSAVDSLREVLGSVSEAVQATASAANEISSSSEEMAAGSSEQSQHTTEVAGAVEQMTKTILESTENVSRAAENSRLASSSAREGSLKVEDTKKGMLEIVKATKLTGDKINSLTKKTDQIGEITQVIDDIADQTNLLALNAAIEAARAGEQGRGFAVVADEVRKLAERTTKATKEIAETIKAIQHEATEADTSMNEASRAVEEGMKLTEAVAQSLLQILKENQNVSDIVTQVAAASEEQSGAAEEISKNIEGISSVTQQSAAGTEQIARAAEDLNRLTVNLQELVSRFHLGGGGEGRSLAQGNNVELLRK
ncbi:MAG: HAMP domain-containing protein [Ignavibacteria bacterium]|jgi:methyl-accepting chemotaxis protein|nr:HAMP domain-containing protein [Ignavibacteria bacterium]MCU7517984.1 HAMP domain-containing protein [Ignavibacteria bacterium]